MVTEQYQSESSFFCWNSTAAFHHLFVIYSKSSAIYKIIYNWTWAPLNSLSLSATSFKYRFIRHHNYHPLNRGLVPLVMEGGQWRWLRRRRLFFAPTGHVYSVAEGDRQSVRTWHAAASILFVPNSHQHLLLPSYQLWLCNSLLRMYCRRWLC